MRVRGKSHIREIPFAETLDHFVCGRLFVGGNEDDIDAQSLPHKNVAKLDVACPSLFRLRPLPPRQSPVSGRNVLDGLLLILDLRDSGFPSAPDHDLYDQLFTMKTTTANGRVTVEQTPFLIPDLTIKELLGAIPCVLDTQNRDLDWLC